MSETDDKRELSGLARSIDALFTSPTRARPPRPEATAAPPEPAPTLGSPEVHAALEPAQELVEASPVVESPWAEVAPDPAFEASAPELTADVGGPTGEEAVSEAAAEPPIPVDSTDADAFHAAIDAFLAGAQGAGADVERLAAELGDRLALDPLADAVEKLVREAGVPPDARLIDMASAIIDPAVASRIVQRIGHERDESRLTEYTALCLRLGDVMAKSFRGALTGATDAGARRKYYDMLIAMSDTCRPIIVEMVDDENTLLVRSGVAILGEIGGDDAVALVTSALANPDARVRREALLSLGKLGDEESGALVVGFLEDPDREVRVAAATAAAALKVDRALRPILAQVEAEGDGDGVIPFLDALGELGDPGAVPAIEKHAVKTLFSRPPAEVRVSAYRALHRIGTPHARDLVQQALQAKEPGIWVAVRQLVDAESPT